MTDIDKAPTELQELVAEADTGARAARGIGGIAIFAVAIAWALFQLRGSPLPEGPERTVYDIGLRLFREYAFAFEVTSVLILVAMVGAIILARKESADA